MKQKGGMMNEDAMSMVLNMNFNSS